MQGWSRAHWQALPNSACCAAPFAESARRPWRRSAGDDDRDGGVRPPPGGRAFRRHRGARWRPDRDVGSQAQRDELSAQDHGRRIDLGVGLGGRHGRATISTTLTHDGAAPGRQLCAERHQGRGHRRAVGRPADRRRRAPRAAARSRAASACFVVDRHSGRSPFAGLSDDRRPARRRSPLMNVQVPASQLLGRKARASPRSSRRDRAIAALCAEAVGAMAELNAATLEYSKTRKQFGVDDRHVPGAAAPHGRHVHALEQARLDHPASALLARAGGRRAARGRRPAPRSRSATPRASSASRPSSCTAAWA